MIGIKVQNFLGLFYLSLFLVSSFFFMFVLYFLILVSIFEMLVLNAKERHIELF